MGSIRKAGWFAALALAAAVWTGVLGSVRGEAVAAMVASHAADGSAQRVEDLAKVRALLEKKVVARMLEDHGVPASEALSKAEGMSDADLHRLASLADRAPDGTSDALGFLIGVAILVILVIVILKLLNKEVIVK